MMKIYVGAYQARGRFSVSLSGGETSWEDSSVVGGSLGAKTVYTVFYETTDPWPVAVLAPVLGSNPAHVALQAVTLTPVLEPEGTPEAV